MVKGSRFHTLDDPMITSTAVQDGIFFFVIMATSTGVAYWFWNFEIALLVSLVFGFSSINMNISGNLTSTNLQIAEARDTIDNTVRHLFKRIEQKVESNLEDGPWSSTTWYDREQRRKSHKFGDFDEGKIYNNAEYLLLRSEGILYDLNLLEKRISDQNELLVCIIDHQKIPVPKEFRFMYSKKEYPPK